MEKKMKDKKEQTLPKRVFINDVDTYSSQNIAKFLSTCVTEETPEDDDEVAASPSEPAFQIVGTVSLSSQDKKPRYLLQQYQSPTREELFEHLLECDVVVYNISENATPQQIEEATWAVTALHEDSENFKTRKMFILVSTVMTWAMTKPQNPADPDSLLTEEEFRRRRPHPAFRNHNNLEKLVLKLGKGNKTKLTGFVVASGLQYGKGENLFHYFFKVSWLMKLPKVPIFGPGTNYIPVIHVFDLAGVIQNIIQLRPKSRYILAVDDSKNTLEEIVKAISDTLGPGEITSVPEQEATTTKAFTAEEHEYFKINLRLEAFILKDFSNLHWTSELGMVESMAGIVEEFKDARQIHPIKICVVGPPAVGKTTVSEKLSQYYKIPHIQVNELIQEKISGLKGTVDGDDAENSPEEDDAAATELDRMNKSMEMNAGRLDDFLVFDILKEKLNSKPCRNRGFVLDGFLKTYEQAQLIFLNEETENQESMDKKPSFNKAITPEHIIALEASDDFLIQRVQALPESVAEEKRYTHDEFLSRLTRHRKLSDADETLLDFFDELEIHPEMIAITASADADPKGSDSVMERITGTVGAPARYGLSAEEQEEEQRREEEAQRERAAAEAAQRKLRNQAALAEMAAQYQEWQENLRELQKQEDELLEARSLPLRNYLMKFVMPTLGEAMVECCRIKPEDPVEFLAEYLLRNNQEG